MVARRGSPPLPGSASGAPSPESGKGSRKEPERHPGSQAKPASSPFWWLRGGQRVANHGSRWSLYGVGLWLFKRQLHLLDCAARAVDGQLAKILALPLVG